MMDLVGIPKTQSLFTPDVDQLPAPDSKSSVYGNVAMVAVQIARILLVVAETKNPASKKNFEKRFKHAKVAIAGLFPHQSFK